MENSQEDSQALAYKLAQAIDPDKAWNGFQIDCIKRGIEAARQEGAKGSTEVVKLRLQALAKSLQEQAEKFSEPGVRHAFDHSAGRVRELLEELQKKS